ncbi:hypothetical protein [Halorubrum sp. HHNYT27]
MGRAAVLGRGVGVVHWIVCGHVVEGVRKSFVRLLGPVTVSERRR